MDGIILAFVIGETFLLMLPAATPGTSHLDFLTALFTATSAVCVTGLSIVTVATELTTVGKIILMVLFRLGRGRRAYGAVEKATGF